MHIGIKIYICINQFRFAGSRSACKYWGNTMQKKRNSANLLFFKNLLKIISGHEILLIFYVFHKAFWLERFSSSQIFPCILLISISMISGVIRKKCTREFFKVFIHWIRAILTVFEKLTCALMFFPNCTSNQTITYTIIYQLFTWSEWYSTSTILRGRSPMNLSFRGLIHYPEWKLDNWYIINLQLFFFSIGYLVCVLKFII